MLPSRTRLIKFKTQSYPRLQVSSKWLAELDFLDSESLNPCENDNAGVLFCEWRVFYALFAILLEHIEYDAMLTNAIEQ